MDRDRMTDSTLCHANLIRAPSVLMNHKIPAPGSHHGRGSGAQCHKIKVSFLMFLDMLLAVMISRLVDYFHVYVQNLFYRQPWYGDYFSKIPNIPPGVDTKSCWRIWPLSPLKGRSCPGQREEITAWTGASGICHESRGQRKLQTGDKTLSHT